MSSVKILNSNSNAKKSAEKSELTRDVMILCLSFLFTIIVACFLLIYIKTNQNQCQSSFEIEKIIEKILDAKGYKKVKNDFKSYERKRGYLDEDYEQENERKKRAATDYRSLLNDEPAVVEFFQPSLRAELEKNDSKIMEQTGAKGAAPRGDSWVWLTSYSRVPFEAIEGFCKKAHDYCPPGPSGAPGLPGLRGMPGVGGPIGPKGSQGIKGERGDKGYRGTVGKPGHDGLNGLPGEPGLDGVPGRAGYDGKNGINGDKGDKGESGLDGTNGKNGTKGDRGTKGQRGERGLTGPQGYKGVAGKDGHHGRPATCILGSVQNDTLNNNIFLAPQIAVSDYQEDKKIIVDEKDNLRLQCLATGNPKPLIKWENSEGVIDWGSYKDVSASGPSINFTSINRVHFGKYKCIAYNGIEPAANHTFDVKVRFKPTIKANDRQHPGGPTATAEFVCITEGYPVPLMHWESPDDLVIQNDTSKYFIKEEVLSPYQFSTTLRIHNINVQADHGIYTCHSKNILGNESMTFSLGANQDGWDKPSTSGETPPIQTYEGFCPPPPLCPFCEVPKDLKCKDQTLSLKDLTGGTDLEVTPLNDTKLSDLGNRTQDCELSMIGKPVFNNYFDNWKIGAWMRDPFEGVRGNTEMIWVTNENEPTFLYEYRNRNDLKLKIQSKKPYRLTHPFTGNAHIVFNGNFYYFTESGGPRILRYELKTEKTFNTTFSFNGTYKNLYDAQLNVIDLNADDNGLWLITAATDSNNTIVSKVNETDMEVLYGLDINIQHNKIGEMFIICGVLYAVDSATEGKTKIRFALDLYNRTLLDKELDFTNPFNASTIAYNYHNKELYTWNQGNLLTYPVRLNAMGTKPAEQPTMDDYMASVGYSIFRNQN